jgi:hypothetical protein
LAVVSQKTDLLCRAISDEMQQINKFNLILKQLVSDPLLEFNQVKPVIIALAEAHHRYDMHCAALKHACFKKIDIERALAIQKSPVEFAANIVKVILAGVVLAGTILSLNPVTLPIGMPMIAAAAILSLTILIVKKTIEVVQKRIEQKRGLTRHVTISIHANNTASIIHTITSQPVVAATAKNKAAAKKDMPDRQLVRSDENIILLDDVEEEGEIFASNASAYLLQKSH